MAPALGDELTAEIADKRPKLEVWRAEVHMSRYTLTFRRIL